MSHREIKIVDGSYALLYDGKVVGTIERHGGPSKDMWGFYPIVPGCGNGAASFVPLHHAMKTAMTFEPTFVED